MAIKRKILCHTERIIRALGSDEPDLHTGNPYADTLIDKMQDVSDKILKKTEKILFKKNRKNSIKM